MSEKDLNHNNWRAKLEALEKLEAESPPDKNASWNRLYSRLDKKRQSRKIIGYWLAAASVLAVMITALFFYLQGPSPLIESPYIGLIEKTAEKETVIKKKNDPVINDSPVVTDKPVLIKEENLFKNQNEKESQNRITEIRLPDTVSLLKNEMIVQTPLIDSLDQKAVIVPVKKKLKVVHINAIDEPSRQSQYMVRAPAKKVFQLNFGDQQAIESPRNIKNKNASLFEIKTSIN